MFKIKPELPKYRLFSIVCYIENLDKDNRIFSRITMPTHSDMIHQPKFWKTFLIFLVPLIVTNILQNLSGTINTIYVGQMLGVDAIAAISVFFPILFAMMAFVIGLSAGATVLVGQAWGAQDILKSPSNCWCNFIYDTNWRNADRISWCGICTKYLGFTRY